MGPGQRGHQTLLPLIQRWVAPGTRIITDQWAAYQACQLNNIGYQHDSVNHHLNFVAPNDQTCHTQQIEGLWKHSKDLIRRLCGTSEANFPSYLREFQWRAAHRRGKACFIDILHEIATHPNYVIP